MISMAINAKNEELDLGPLPRKTRDQFSDSVCILYAKFGRYVEIEEIAIDLIYVDKSEEYLK